MGFFKNFIRGFINSISLSQVLVMALVFWTVQYFFLSQKTPQQESYAGQSFIAPTEQENHKPLNKKLVLESESESVSSASTVLVRTLYGILTFSTSGAVLERLEFIRTMDMQERTVTPIQSSKEQQSVAFLVAVEDQTPLVYVLTDQKKEAEKTILVYKAHGAFGDIQKTFTIAHDVPRVDLEIVYKRSKKMAMTDGGQTLRLFLPAPYVAEADVLSLPTIITYDASEKGLKRKDPTQVENLYWIDPTLFGFADRYFVNALVHDEDTFASRAYFMGESADKMTAIFETVPVKDEKTWKLTFYCGPKDVDMMVPVDQRLELTLDYGRLASLVKLLSMFLHWIYRGVKNYGWAIIILTFLIRLLMAPLTFKGYRAMGKQKEYQQKMRYIEQKYKDEPDILMQERLALTKKYGASMMGCLPQFLQFPILFALNTLLNTSYDLYQAPFIGWITDLSARDPYYVLPVFAGIGILIQTTENSDIRGGMVMLVFSALIIAFTANFAAGLTLYLCVNTWLSIAQTRIQKVVLT